jgi:hypothetical protein
MDAHFAVIGNAVPASIPLGCRRGVRIIRQNPGAACDGVLAVDLHSIRLMLERGEAPTARCPKCGLIHGFLVMEGVLMYGAIL